MTPTKKTPGSLITILVYFFTTKPSSIQPLDFQSFLFVNRLVYREFYGTIEARIATSLPGGFAAPQYAQITTTTGVVCFARANVSVAAAVPADVFFFSLRPTGGARNSKTAHAHESNSRRPCRFVFRRDGRVSLIPLGLSRAVSPAPSPSGFRAERWVWDSGTEGRRGWLLRRRRRIKPFPPHDASVSYNRRFRSGA